MHNNQTQKVQAFHKQNKIPMFPLFPRGVESNIAEKSSQLELEHVLRILSRVKEPFLKLKFKTIYIHDK